VPEGRARTYARLVFFLPSLLFWPSSIGKEAWMMFALGIASYGAARMLTGSTIRALPVTVLGLWLAAIVRPHVAGLLVLALGGASLIRPARERLKEIALLGKVAGLAVLLVMSVLLVRRTGDFIQRQTDIPLNRGITSVLTGVSERTSEGGSGFQPSILDSPARAPIAAITVLFRPLLPDAGNPQALAAGIEGTFLLLLALVRLPWIWSAAKSIRRQPYVAFAFLYAGLFIVAFSAVGNFGLLARERVQLLPLFLVLLTIPPKERESAKPRFLYGRV
jgi:hypothetical protein